MVLLGKPPIATWHGGLQACPIGFGRVSQFVNEARFVPSFGNVSIDEGAVDKQILFARQDGIFYRLGNFYDVSISVCFIASEIRPLWDDMSKGGEVVIFGPQGWQARSGVGSERNGLHPRWAFSVVPKFPLDLNVWRVLVHARKLDRINEHMRLFSALRACPQTTSREPQSECRHAQDDRKCGKWVPQNDVSPVSNGPSKATRLVLLVGGIGGALTWGGCWIAGRPSRYGGWIGALFWVPGFLLMSIAFVNARFLF